MKKTYTIIAAMFLALNFGSAQVTINGKTEMKEVNRADIVLELASQYSSANSTDVRIKELLLSGVVSVDLIQYMRAKDPNFVTKKTEMQEMVKPHSKYFLGSNGAPRKAGVKKIQ